MSSSLGKDAKNPDADFLSSIELLIMDQTDALLMQNWEHMLFLMNHINQSPKDGHGCDFSRVRMWYLEDQAKYLRQTLIFTPFISPDINALFNRHMHNVLGGKLKITAPADGSVLATGLPVSQTFARFDSPSPQADPDARFKFFTATVVPWILRLPRPPEGGQGILLFVPSYFDFVRLRNYLATNPTVTNVSFASISENQSPADPEVRRARSHFLTGKISLLLYTGRAHHFWRYLIKGVKRVVIYQLPDNPVFYQEVTGGFLGASVAAGRIAPHEGRVRCLFSRWDVLRLVGIVGTDRVAGMLRKGDTFDFV